MIKIFIIRCYDCGVTTECEDRKWQKLTKIGWRKINQPEFAHVCPIHALNHSDAY